MNISLITVQMWPLAALDLGDTLILAGFTGWDWGVVVGYLVLTTLLGGALAGKQATIRDFFLGGRKLPWYAVSGSIIATEISAVTFVGVPAMVFAAGGNFSYLQLCLLGAIGARLIVGYVLVPAYYQREIYSPYDFMADRLGPRVRTMTTCLFTLGGMLAQGARVYLTAFILDLIIGDSLLAGLAEATGFSTLAWCILLIGIVAVGWTLLGGITTVIWTDVILFLVFLTGGVIALLFILADLPDGWRTLTHAGLQAGESGPWGKFTLFDFSLDPTRTFTFWTGAIAYTVWCVAIYGTDQLLAQRMFCCAGQREARRAIISSAVGQIITVIMLLVGVGLFAFYQLNPLDAGSAALVADKPDRIFPIFIINQLPVGVTGLLIAGIFAAAISSLDSVLAALSQTTLSAFYLPWKKRRAMTAGIEYDDHTDSRHVVFLSRLLVVFWGVILCGMAFVAEAATAKFPQILNLALSMAGYTGGALLAGFMLAFMKYRLDDRGYLFAAPLSVLFVFGLIWHQPWARTVCLMGTALMLLLWLAQNRGNWKAHDIMRSLVFISALLLTNVVCRYGYFERMVDPQTRAVSYVTIAWPWLCPIGFIIAAGFGILLAGRRDTA